MNILLALLLSGQTLASVTDCGDLITNASCSIEWTEGKATSTLILTEEKNGCEFPEGKKQNCARLVHCRDSKVFEVGATVFLESANRKTFCLPSKPYDLFNSSFLSGPSAFVKCDANRKPTAVELVGSNKISKLCKFPVGQK